ncbi:Cna B-type domain-containing protein [Urinicoccus timonensis]|uniref:Cna B-type domain-containing protein n=1 Tax=Urinicoccus timonensis TaxID=2024205 RepID=UPI000C088476|nr:S-layer homology domain-containing protein [Urinicoccus timonensis]
MKIRRGLAMVLVFLLVMTHPALAADKLGQKSDETVEFFSEIKHRHPRGGAYRYISFGSLYSGGIQFQEESFRAKVFTEINNKEYDLSSLIPEFGDLTRLGQLTAYESGFDYKLDQDGCDFLTKIDNETSLKLTCKFKRDKDNYNYGGNARHDSIPRDIRLKGSKKISVIWDDDNDRDGIRTKQEVYYLKLQSENDKNPAYKILEIPKRGTNEESQFFGNIPMTWETYSLDGRNLEGYEKIIDPQEDGSLKITYKHIPAKVDFHVKVVWKDENNKFGTRPDHITASLSSKGGIKNYSIGSTQDWERSFQEFKYEKGEEIAYNLSFPDIDKYEKTVKRDGEDYSSPQEGSENYSIGISQDWQESFQEFKYKEGKEIAYSLSFPDLDKYEKKIEKVDNDYTVTYTSKLKSPEEIKPIAKKTIKATKTWIGGPESDHKQVDLKLYRKITPGQEELVGIAPQVKEDNGKFIYSWEKMPVTDSKGEEYKYFVKEAKVVENYTVSYDGFNVTNRYESPKKDVKVNVQWIHGDPQETNIILYRKNLNTELEKVGEFKSDKDHLSQIFEKLPVTDKNGLEYSYYAYEPVVPEGFTVSYSDDDLTVTNTRIPEEKPSPSPSPRGNRTLVASKPLSPILNRENHYQYLVGYKDQTFRGENKMTREEVVVMFSRLLKNPPQKGQIYPHTFSDVEENRWSITAISYLEQVGIIKGYPDGSFRPDAEITRAEFAAMASKFADLKEGEKNFKDLDRDHWAYDLVKKAASAGWIHGYPDGTFKADKKISRAEVVSITNKMLNRQADKKFVDENLGRLLTFSDLDRDYWAYYPIIEATNGHDYIRCGNKVDEEWKEVTNKSFVYDK